VNINLTPLPPLPYKGSEVFKASLRFGERFGEGFFSFWEMSNMTHHWKRLFPATVTLDESAMYEIYAYRI